MVRRGVDDELPIPPPNPRGPGPLYLQVAHAIEEGIRSGQFRVGQRLPAERRLAAQLAISRITVTNAYQELEARGLLRGHVGRGTIVVAAPGGVGAASIPWAQRTTQLTAQAVQVYFGPQPHRPDVISFAAGWPHPALHPPSETLDSLMPQREKRETAQLYGAGSAHGDARLREALSSWLGSRGIKANPDQVLITAGAQQGLNLLARAFLAPGDVVVTESPTFFGALLAFRWAGADVVGVPVDHEGIQCDLLEEALARHRPKLIYVIPTFQNPTGTVLSPERRRLILELAARFRVPVVESDLYGEISFEGAPPRRLKALDGDSGIVIYQGSFSKMAVPGLRVGWLVAPTGAMVPLTAAKVAADCFTAILPQRIVAEFIRAGHLDRHLPMMRKGCRLRRDALVASLRQHCPALRFRIPPGGYFLWAQLPAPLTTEHLLPSAEEAGVSVRPGSQFRPEEGRDNHVRLCFAGLSPPEIADGGRRLGQAVENAARRVKAGPRRESLTPVSVV